MSCGASDHTLEFLLAFHGRIHHLEQGYWIKFDIAKVEATEARPYGIAYSFTLHGPDGKRLIGFDNAHAVSAAGSRFSKRSAAIDHWHRAEVILVGHMASRTPIRCCKTSFVKSGVC